MHEEFVGMVEANTKGQSYSTFPNVFMDLGQEA